MVTKPVRDEMGRIIGFEEKTSNGSTVAYDSRRKRLGFYSSPSKNTHESDGRRVGAGDQTGRLLGRSERKKGCVAECLSWAVLWMCRYRSNIGDSPPFGQKRSVTNGI